MRNKLLYINDTLIDLYPDTVIAQTIQAFEIGSLGSVRTNYTNQIKVPKTATNKRALQFSDDSKSQTSFPYTSYSAKYVENGIEIIRNGRVVIHQAAQDFTLNILSGPVGFFDSILTKKLWDLDFSDLNSEWEDTDRDAARNATTGIVAPLLDDGIATYNGSIPAIEHQGSYTKHPWVYYHTVIDKIFETAGYEKSGDIFTDPAYLAMAVPLTLTWSPPFRNAKGFSAAAPGNQSIVNPASYTDITFDDVSINGSDGFYDGTSVYGVSNADTSIAYFIMRFTVHVTVTVSGGTVDLVLQKNNFPTQTNLASHTNIGSGTYSLGTSFAVLGDGDLISVRAIKNTGTPTVTVTYGTFAGECGDILGSVFAGYMYFNHLFEDINQIDFLKDFSVRFNVKMIERNGVIVCKTMNEILADAASAIDWTDKRIPGDEKLLYALDGIAQTNDFTYDSDNLADDLSDDFGKGSFLVDNENLKERQTIFNSMFAMTDMIMFADLVYIASIPAGSDEPSLGIRCCMMRQNTADDPTVYYNVTGRTDYKVAYFVDPNYEYSMHWQYFIDNHYADFVVKLQKAKALTRKYRLSDIDIHTFDQLKPIYDNGEIFIVTKINNYVSGFAPEVELFKIN